MRIFLDMDETLVNLVDPWLALLNAKAGTEHTRKDTVGYSVEKTFASKLTTYQVFEPFNTPGFWSGLLPFSGAVDFVQRLVDNDFDVYLATVPAQGEVCHHEKEQWVMEHLPFIGRERLIFVHHKYTLRGEALLDDNPKYLAQFKGHRLLFDRPWNQSQELFKLGFKDSWYNRVYSYDGVFSFLMQMELPF